MKTTILTDTNADAVAFLEKLTAGYNDFKDNNVIIDLSAQDGLTFESLLPYLPLSDKHRKGKKSFVLVVKDFDIDENPDELIVVPTVQEAHDIIEMEEIERDLGF
ncbi:ribonuclease Z [Flavobacterium sp. RHBU_3]|uniref:ribonuclease Z n=1 Tax=Flavobacterium sp. RHBU_3 TaxID=3391184 RepID=UPI00398545AF